MVLVSKTIVLENNSYTNNSDLLEKAKKQAEIPSSASYEVESHEHTTHFVYKWNYSDTVR